jgi:SH3 domain protein
MKRSLLGLGLALAPLAARADYVRDEVFVHLRAGPGLEYKILKLLKSGDAVTKLSETDDWIQTQTGEGQTGWIPSGYLSAEPPPSVALPKVKEQLAQAETRIDELETKVASQGQALDELDSLRQRSSELESENARLSVSSTWKNMATGVAILLLGALIGLVIPRGGVSSRTRLKL